VAGQYRVPPSDIKSILETLSQRDRPSALALLLNVPQETARVVLNSIALTSPIIETRYRFQIRFLRVIGCIGIAFGLICLCLGLFFKAPSNGEVSAASTHDNQLSFPISASPALKFPFYNGTTNQISLSRMIGNPGFNSFDVFLDIDDHFTNITVHWGETIYFVTLQTSKGHDYTLGTSAYAPADSNTSGSDHLALNTSQWLQKLGASVRLVNGNMALTGLSFIYDGGDTKQFGDPENDSLSAPSGWEICGFAGSYNNYLESIAIYVRPKRR
jgi:hypothetical protein